NTVPMEQVIKGLDEKDKDTLLLILSNMKRLQFNFVGSGNKKSEGERLVEKLLPMIAHEDEELAKSATFALNFQMSYMGDPQKVDAIKKVAPYAAGEKAKYIRVNAVNALAKLNQELAQNLATISMCDLEPLVMILESDDPLILKPTLETMAKCGTEREHRIQVKKVLDRFAGRVKEASDAVKALTDQVKAVTDNLAKEEDAEKKKTLEAQKAELETKKGEAEKNLASIEELKGLADTAVQEIVKRESQE
ncbi:MAG: HEAT repeat domain-containing protein, partial [Planctomycetota bacterium]